MSPDWDGRVLDVVQAGAEPRLLDHTVRGPRAWTAASLRREDMIVRVDAEMIDELRALRTAVGRTPGMPVWTHKLSAVRERLADGSGLVIVDRLPLDQMTEDEATEAYWGLGLLLARPVPTKRDGTFVYHVTDTGKAFGPGVRGSATNVELSFHTDNAFGLRMPEFVGLLCLRPAIAGGITRACSLYSVHNELLRAYPHLLRRLYEPVFFDRQGEHGPGAPPVLRAPLFTFDGRDLWSRLVPGLIERGYRLIGIDMDRDLIEALARLKEVCARSDLAIEFALERGQIQYMDNRTCGHFRSQFTDAADPTLKRHLLRVWYRDAGEASYDG